MCRFALYTGPPLTLDTLITQPTHSIIHQSFDSKERSERLNGDGFGVAWYVPELSREPAVFRSITPAWNNRNLTHLARLTRAGCVLAHVRAASHGLPVTESNCHPFVCGRYAFMHNGQIGDFRRVRRRLGAALSDEAFAMIEGSTDSELLFAMFLENVWKSVSHDPLESIAAALVSTLDQVLRVVSDEGVEERSDFNIAVSDGTVAVASRATTADPSTAASLYYHEGRRYTCDDGVCRMVEPDAEHRAVLICSEALSTDPGWHAVPANHLVLARSPEPVLLRPLSLPRVPERSTSTCVSAQA